jgi:hypothetical protein
MIKATGSTQHGVPLLILGLSRENTRRLHDGQPIRIRVDHVDPRLPTLEVVLMAGDTEESLTAALRTAFELPSDDQIPGRKHDQP